MLWQDHCPYAVWRLYEETYQAFLFRPVPGFSGCWGTGGAGELSCPDPSVPGGDGVQPCSCPGISGRHGGGLHSLLQTGVPQQHQFPGPFTVRLCDGEPYGYSAYSGGEFSAVLHDVSRSGLCVLFWGDCPLPGEIAHFLGISTTSVSSFIGHKFFSFREAGTIGSADPQ